MSARRRLDHSIIKSNKGNSNGAQYKFYQIQALMK